MRIAIFTDTFYPGVGGTENAVIGLATELSKNNEVVVCAPRPKKSYDDSKFCFKVLRCKSIKLPQDDECYGFPAISNKFRKKLKQFAPEIIHCQTVNSMTAFGIKYAKKHKIPVIMTVHTKFKMVFERSTNIKFIINMLVRAIANKMNKCDGVYAVSNDLARDLKDYGAKSEINVIRNGATFSRIEDTESIKQLASEKYNLSNESNILLFVGHIVKFKNLKFLIDALKIVKQRNVPFKMLFVGHGLDSEYFKKYVIKSNLQDVVLFTEQITDKTLLSSIYSNADLMLFPSIFDNDSLALVEAALHKVPALTIKDTGSSERIVNNVSGYVSENNVESYAERIIEILSDKDSLRQVGINAEKTVPTTWATTAEKYMEVYQQKILQKNNSKRHKKCEKDCIC